MKVLQSLPTLANRLWPLRHSSTTVISNARAFSQQAQPESLSNSGTRAAGISSPDNMAAESMPSISLLPREKLLCRILSDCALSIDHDVEATSGEQSGVSEAASRQRLTLRFAGGWVRDKLMGRESHDIDVAISSMTGMEFGTAFYDWLSTNERSKDYGLDPEDFHGLHKIKQNPSASKHLETCTTRFLDLDIDFVNLRKEEYNEKSRTPTMTFGTAEEDALRRDATINSLFYNVQQEAVEDYTRQGLQDMKNRLLRTPLDPYQTFKDDPLRVLRLIRFQSQLAFRIDPAALDAMRREDIQDALKLKISRERVNTELSKSLRSSRPAEALRSIVDLNLYNIIFTDPSATDSAEKISTEGFQQTISLAEKLIIPGKALDIENVKISSLIGQSSSWTADDRYLAWVLTSLAPVVVHDPPRKARGKVGWSDVPLALRVAQHGVKMPNAITNILSAALEHSEEVQRLLDPPKLIPATEVNDAQLRAELGFALYQLGPAWKHLVFLTAMTRHLQLVRSQQSEADTDICKQLNALCAKVEQLGLSLAFELKPLLPGKKLADRLGQKAGPWTKYALRFLLKWQFAHPAVCATDEAVENVKSHMDEILQQAQEEIEATAAHKEALKVKMQQDVAELKRKRKQPDDG